MKKTRTSEKIKFDLEEAFSRFIIAREAEGRSPRTIERDRTNFKTFLEYLDKRNLQRDIRLVTKELIRDYVVWMLHEKVRFEGHKYKSDDEKTVGLSPTTVNTRLKTLKVFFRFLKDEELIEHNPTEDVQNVRENETDIRILTPDEIRRLLEVPDRRSYAEFRDFVLMNLLLDSMIRINEALTLRQEDVSFVDNTITIRGVVSKNRRSRILPIQSRTAKLLKELIKEVEEFDSKYIFLANYGEPLTANHFRNRLRIYSKKAGLDFIVHPHLFRHTGATMFLENGGDVRYLQILLGHKDLRTVIRYTPYQINQ